MDWARGYDVLEDHTGDLWVGTPSGLLRFPEVSSVAQLARARPKASYSVANGLPAARVAPVFEDSRGDLWMSGVPRVRPPRCALATFDRPFSSVSGD